MKTYEHVGDIYGLDGKWRPAFRCVDCGALVDTIAEHDTYHAKVDAMYRAVVHLMEPTGERE